MKTKMTLGGIGPKLALMCLPYVILSLIIMKRDPGFFCLEFLDNIYFQLFGYLWMVFGVLFWVASALVFLAEFKKGKLITQGTFRFCRNPIYASIIVFVVPALAVIFHSGILLSIDLVLLIGFKLAIHGENILLQRVFGIEYENYKKAVNEIIPFPRFLFYRKAVTRNEE